MARDRVLIKIIAKMVYSKTEKEISYFQKNYNLSVNQFTFCPIGYVAGGNIINTILIADLFFGAKIGLSF